MKPGRAVVLTATVSLLSVAAPAAAQQVSTDLTLHMERLPVEEQLYLDGVDREVEKLVLDYTWGDGRHNFELPVKIDILFDSYSRTATYRKYGAGIMVASPSGIQLRDTRWDFRIDADRRLHFGEPYDSFTGLIEFYIWFCIGFELDYTSPLAGQPAYERAFRVADAARFDIRYSDGWDRRRDLIRDVSRDTTFRNIRSAAYHARAGIYYVEKEQLESARSHLVRAGELMLRSDPKLPVYRRDDHIIRFIDIESLAAALALVGETGMLEQLAEWDPERAAVYRQ